MANNFLLEVGLEEMPAHVVTPAIKQLKNQTEKFLNDKLIKFDEIEVFSTPRRLAVLVTNIAEKQLNQEVDAKGPALKIAKDEDGNWSNAAKGFAKGQGLDVTDLTVKDVNGVNYVYAHKSIEGLPTSDVLKEMKDVILKVSFPTTMRWASNNNEYVRPIHWIVALFNNQVVDFTVFGTKTGNRTKGHRFLGEEISINDASSYEDALAKGNVVADSTKRKDLIVHQIKEWEKINQKKVNIDDDLLEEVTNLVEVPTVFSGSFDQEYLKLPDEVLVTSMKDNQRYFDVYDNGQLINNFVSVRNGNSAYIDNVKLGNEKVLKARLEDAKFFFNDDLKQPLDDIVERLQNVTFYQNLGSLADKAKRVKQIALYLNDYLQLHINAEDIERLSDIYKFDLTTEMVGEFPELQGTMGKIYAKKFGESEIVSEAIGEQYLPDSANGVLPQTDAGKLLSVADKLDSILMFFAVGKIPNGSADPFALRRSAQGIVRIIIENDYDFDIDTVFSEISKVITSNNLNQGLDLEAIKESFIDFMMDRVVNELKAADVSYDVINAVTNSNNKNIKQLVNIAKWLEASKKDKTFTAKVDNLTRILKIVAKNPVNDPKVDPSLFENDYELKLYNESMSLNKEGEFSKSDYDALLNLTPEIDDFFENNMVITEDEKLKFNRLSLLSGIADQINKVGDLTQIIL